MPCSRSLMYHDLVDYGEAEESGFRNPWAAAYKLSMPQFRRHLAVIAGSGARVSLITSRQPGVSLFLTFDDGGSSSVEAAGLLEQHGWRGHFFVPTDFIGQPGFLDECQIRELHAQGHLIGSHSCSHPTRMAALEPSAMAHEWRTSRERLESILGEEVTVASVPGGYYSTAVGEAAAAAGVRYLFYSEPLEQWKTIGGCALIGRYSIQRTTTDAQAGSFATGRWQACLAQRTIWNLKKVLKTLNPRLYLRVASRFRS